MYHLDFYYLLLLVLYVAVTGNESVGFAEEDFNDDFDPESYDKRMSKVFGDDYYGQEEEEKPVFPSDEGTYHMSEMGCNSAYTLIVYGY